MKAGQLDQRLYHFRHVFPVEEGFCYVERIQMFRLRPYLRAANVRIAPLFWVTLNLVDECW